MKRIVTSISLFVFCISLLNLSAFKASAQASLLYSQNFDTTNQLPTGWSIPTGGWILDTSKGSNVSTGYTGASGLNCLEVANDTFLQGTFQLISNAISTVNYVSITADWATRNTKHFADSGSVINGFYWSSDNGNNWNQVSYNENAGNSSWSIDNGGTPITLPVGAEQQASLRFRWVATLSPNYQGTYRIDDFNVSGIFSQASGVKNISAVTTGNALGNVFVQNNAINIYSSKATNEKVSVEVFNILGNTVKSTVMNSSKLVLNTTGLSSGVYFVRLSTSTTRTVNKVVLN